MKKYIKNILSMSPAIEQIARLALQQYRLLNYSAPRMLEGELKLFRSIYKYCQNVFDVGSRYDVDYIEISQGNNINYYLFEINPKFFARLKKNLEVYFQSESIFAENCGIGECDGELYYYSDSESVLRNTTSIKNSRARSSNKLPIRSLESYL